MSVLCDSQIRELVGIEPYSPAQKRPGKVSYGVSSYGYDVRVGSRFKIFSPTPVTGDIAVVDPKRFSDEMMVEVDTEVPGHGGTDNGSRYIIIPPNSFALCETVEYIEVPRDVLVICVGKSNMGKS